MSRVRVITTPDLIELNRRAVAANRNRSFVDGIEELLDPSGVHVVAMAMLHNDVEVRTNLLLKFTDNDTPMPGWLDMTVEEYQHLQEVDA